jgi:hypothetical protein
MDYRALKRVVFRRRDERKASRWAIVSDRQTWHPFPAHGHGPAEPVAEQYDIKTAEASFREAAAVGPGSMLVGECEGELRG